MVLEEVVAAPTEAVLKVAEIALWLKALGILTVLFVIASTTNFFLNIYRARQLKKFEDKIVLMDKKLDKILARKK